MAINEALPSLDNGSSKNSQTLESLVKKRDTLDNSLLLCITLSLRQDVRQQSLRHRIAQEDYQQ
jgi:hypothetical protein